MASNALDSSGFTVEKTSFTPPPPPGADPSSDAPGPGTVGQRSCSYPGVVFFAGRSEDFESLLGGINESGNSDPPTLLGGDDVARLAADADRVSTPSSCTSTRSSNCARTPRRCR
ncbi:hypothetical protein [Streptomyces sp. NPDC048637]|uniref:hypothetical protein n=1 Tax=Streptomyces sp. NPDC048637 TaxID=3155636 RepID=UPI00342DA648